jgi:hypothetical protein
MRSIAAIGLGCAIVSQCPVSPSFQNIPKELDLHVPSYPSTYLVCHDSLLETRANHSPLAGLLAPAPDSLAVGRLHGTQLLALLYALLEDLVLAALRGSRGGIGGRNGRPGMAAFGIVGRDGVVGGGAVCAAQCRQPPGRGA